MFYWMAAFDREAIGPFATWKELTENLIEAMTDQPELAEDDVCVLTRTHTVYGSKPRVKITITPDTEKKID